MNTNLSSLSNLEAVLIGLVVAGFFVVRQFSVRRVESVWMVLIPLGLAYFGASALGNLGTAALVSLAINTSVGRNSARDTNRIRRRSFARPICAAALARALPQRRGSTPAGAQLSGWADAT